MSDLAEQIVASRYRPASGGAAGPQLPSAEDAFGAPPKLPSAEEAFGAAPRVSPGAFAESYALAEGGSPAPMTGEDFDAYFTRSPAAQVLDAFGQGFKNGWGSRPIGLSDAQAKWMETLGGTVDRSESPLNLWHDFNTGIMRPLAAGLDAANRAGWGIYGGIDRAAGGAPSAFARAAVRGAIPAITALPGAAAGAEVGAFAGAPLAPFTFGLSEPAGALIGGLGGALVGGRAGAAARDMIFSHLPNWALHVLGQMPEEQQADIAAHPIATFAGELAPNALFFSPFAGERAAQYADNVVQRLLAHPATRRLLPAAIMAGQEAGTEYAEGQPFSPARIGVSALIGAAQQRPTAAGQALLTGGSLGYWLSRGADLAVIGPGGEAAYQGLPSADETAAQQEAIARLSPAGQQAGLAPPPRRMVSNQAFGPPEPPGPESPYVARLRLGQAALSEYEPPPAPDLHAMARGIEPELFHEYDSLAAQRDTMRHWLGELGEMRDRGTTPAIDALDRQIDDLRGQRLELPEAERPAAADRITALENERAGLVAQMPTESGSDTAEMARIRQDMLAADYRMRDLAPQVSSAYRRAAGMEPAAEEAPAPPPAASAEAQATEAPPAAIPIAPAEHATPAPTQAPATQIGYSNSTPEIRAAAAALPPPGPGYVRMYHGGVVEPHTGGGRWVAQYPEYAAHYREGGKLYYVDVPENSSFLHETYDRTGIPGARPSYANVEVPEEIAAQMKPVPVAPTEAVAAPQAPERPPIPGSIAGDVAKQLVSAGRPAEEADAAGALVQAHYDAWSKAFPELGSADEIYQQEAARVVAGRGARQTLEFAQPPNEMEQSRRGKIRLGDPANAGRPTITLFKEADASTFIHETGHAWLEELMKFAADKRAPTQVSADADTVRNWLGVNEGEQIPTRAHEKFARGFERYMMEGHAPSEGLAGVFAKFKQWLTTIYQTVSKLRSPISDDIRGVFDRMLAAPEREPVIAPEHEPTESFAALHEVDAEHTPAFEAPLAAYQIRMERDRIAEAAAPEIEDERAKVRSDAAATAAATEPGTAAGGSDGGGGVSGAEGAGPRSANGSENGIPQPGAQRTGGGQAATEGNRLGSGAGNSATPADTNPNLSLGPGDERLIDKAGNIRLDNLSAPDDVDAVIRDTAERNSDFIPERRGTISDGQMLDLADALGKDPAFLDSKKIGQAFNAEEVLAARGLLVKSAYGVRAALLKAESGSPADIADLAKALARHEMIQGKVSQATAEWGRAGRAFRALDGWEQARDLNQFLKENTGRDLYQLGQMARLGKFLKTPGQVSKLVADTSQGKVRQAIIYYWTNTLISGPITHLTYSVGNAINALWRPLVETPLAATSGAVREAIGMPAADRVYFNEALAELYGLGKGFRDGLGAATTAWRYGLSAPLPGERAANTMIDASLTNPLRQIGVPRPIAEAIGVPGRAVSAIHSFFKTLRYEQNIQALAMRDALAKGLDGNARDLHVARLTTSPTPEMMEAATADALKELYMRPQPFDSPGARITRAANSSLPLKIIAPFMRIGSEIVRNAYIERTPLGFASKEVRGNLLMREGGAAFDMQLGKIMAGTGLMGATVLGVLEGNITGDGPSDPDERRVWLLTNHPNSVSVGPIRFSYARMGHLAMLMRFASDMTETAERWDDTQGNKMAGSFFNAITRSVLDETWMRGVKDTFDAIYHPEEYFDSWATNFVAQWTPFSIGLGQVARLVDPYQRETRDLTMASEIFNQIKGHTPLWSESLLARRDVFGEPISTGSASVDRYSTDPTALALNDLHIGIKPPERKIRGVALTPDQYDDYARVGGRLAKMELDATMNIGFRMLPQAEQIKMIKATVTHAHEAAAAQIMMESMGGPNDIVRQASQAKAAALLPAN